ncbi:MAG TPA: type II secretion system minor pseudopilin GspK [Myxococcota bacterium]|nr:type II secretion system minor pseudopilin GspK [Myxococcota bacterium]
MSAQRERGIVLVIVLVFALLLASSIATFVRRATVDDRIAYNREAASRAEAMARGGVRLAWALLLEDKLLEKQGSFQGETLDDLWAMAGLAPIPLEDGSTLRLVIEDASSKLNLNAVLAVDKNGAVDQKAKPFLTELMKKVIADIPLPPAEKVYDTEVLVDNLIDHVDPDDVSQQGGSENDAFERGESPVGPNDRNRPLLSLDELRLIPGFDSTLVEALRPYVTVYPYISKDGINPNTAPPYVLALIYYNDGVQLRLADEDMVRRLLAVRQDGWILCGSKQSDESCKPINEIVENDTGVFPPLAYSSNVFVVKAEAQVGSVQRRIEAILDRSQGAKPLLLSWRVL